MAHREYCYWGCRHWAVATTLFLFVVGWASPSAGQVDMQFRIIAKSGDPAPDGRGTLNVFGRPVLNNDGHAAFVSGIAGAGNASAGVFLGDGVDPLLQLARRLDPAPDGNGVYDQLLEPAINPNGQVLFQAFFRGTAAKGPEERGIFRGDGINPVVQLVRGGDPAPNGDGVLNPSNQSNPAFNASGQVGLRSGIADTAGGSSDNGGVFRTDNTGTLLRIVRKGDPAPGGGVLSTFQNVAMNDAGQVAINTSLTGAGFLSGVFVGDGVDPLKRIARAGDPVPNGSGVFQEFDNPEINNAGQLLFSAALGRFDTSDGLYLADVSGGIAEIARIGELTPDGESTLTSIGAAGLNDAGDILYRANLLDLATGTQRGLGLYRQDSFGALVEIFGFEGPAPNGNGTFGNNLTQVALNEHGQVAFHIQLRNTAGGSSDRTGIFFFDDALGLVKVIRAGDAFMGSTILRVSQGEIVPQDEYLALNDRGQVAFAYTLVNGESGVAIWTSRVPEPTTAILLTLSLSLGLLLRRPS